MRGRALRNRGAHPFDFGAAGDGIDEDHAAKPIGSRGTDLVPILLLPGSEPDLLIDLSGLEELKSIHCTAGKLHVGALVTFSQLESALNDT